MTKQEIDKAAYKGTEISSPKIADEIYWLGMYYIYKIVKADSIPSEQAKKIKSEFSRRIESIEQWEEIFVDSLGLMSELDKLIAPEAELVSLSKYALVDKIIRFEAILNGTLKKYDGKIPELYHRIYEQLKEMEENENASNT
jgi:hypothetical protein